MSFQGEGSHVGERHLFVRLSGCNLRCRYCDTPDSLERESQFVVHSTQGSVTYDNPVAPSAVADIVESLLALQGPIDAISITGGEPLMQPRFLLDLLSLERFRVPVLLETSGMLPKPLAEILGRVDIVSMDIKLPSNTGEPGFWAEHTEFLRVASAKEVYAKILIDHESSDEDFERALALLALYPQVPVFLQPIVASAGYQNNIDMGQLDRLQRLARQRLPSVRVVPQTHKFLGIR